ncbi:MAG TPA: helix-turn-helix transcriptional regulator [Mycobacteriales bacterium]
MCENRTAETLRSWTEIGERVAEARRAAGLSQADLAGRVGMDRTALVRVEAGERKVSALELMRLAEQLGRSTGWAPSIWRAVPGRLLGHRPGRWARWPPSPSAWVCT